MAGNSTKPSLTVPTSRYAASEPLLDENLGGVIQSKARLCSWTRRMQLDTILNTDHKHVAGHARVCLCVCVAACACVCVRVCVGAGRRDDPPRLGRALLGHAGMLCTFTLGLGLGRQRIQRVARLGGPSRRGVCNARAARGMLAVALRGQMREAGQHSHIDMRKLMCGHHVS